MEVRRVGPVRLTWSAQARGHTAILNQRTCTTKRKTKLSKVVQMPECLPRLVSAEVIAASTGWSVKHVYRLAQLRQIPHYRIGGTVRFDPQEIAEWLEAHRIAALPGPTSAGSGLPYLHFIVLIRAWVPAATTTDNCASFLLRFASASAGLTPFNGSKMGFDPLQYLNA